MLDLQSQLKMHFGFDRFRPMQHEIITALMQGNSAVGILPTGAGKSVCYQLPALLLDGITVVISPLISLMKDQTDSLVAKGISAIAINSHDTPAEGRSKLAAVARGETKLVFVAPERLQNGPFLDACSRVKISLLAVDEAHCVSQWGHDFRPEYRQIPAFHAAVGFPPLLALTATARPSVQQDLMQQLGVANAHLFRSSADRSNLWIGLEACRTEVEREAKIAYLLREQSGSAIVYATSRKDAQKLAERLTEQLEEPVACYHAGMGAEQRTAVQNQFMTDMVRVVVATNAFGMGIDKSDIRTVVHAGVSDSLEGYFQEIGRAGRDGFSSRCVMVLIPGRDVKAREFLVRQSEDPHASERFRRICSYLFLANECRRVFLMRYFGEQKAPQPEACCSSCHPMSIPDKALILRDRTPRARRQRLQRTTLAFQSVAGRESASASGSAFSSGSALAPGLEQELLAGLKEWRRRKAAAMGVPPFIIFGDRDLASIVEVVPTTLTSLSACRGIGPTKLKLYGPELLVEIAKVVGQPKGRAADRAELLARTGQLFAQGQDVAAIASEIGRAEGTVWQYLVDWIGLDPSDAWKEAVRRVLPREAYREVVPLFRSAEGDRLKPIFDHCEGRYTYEQIRVARAVFEKAEGGGIGTGIREN